MLERVFAIQRQIAAAIGYGDHPYDAMVGLYEPGMTLKQLRGVLDPLRVAPAHLRQDATVSFLLDLLPVRAEPTWETAVIAAVDRVIASASRPTCLEVVRALHAGDTIDRQVGSVLEVYSRSGLTQLGFADPAYSDQAQGLCPHGCLDR